MQIVTETEAETEAAPGVMQGDLWSRCLADAASKRRGGQSLGKAMFFPVMYGYESWTIKKSTEELRL